LSRPPPRRRRLHIVVRFFGPLFDFIGSSPTHSERKIRARFFAIEQTKDLYH
jgi:hypothetical protein